MIYSKSLVRKLREGELDESTPWIQGLLPEERNHLDHPFGWRRQELGAKDIQATLQLADTLSKDVQMKTTTSTYEVADYLRTPEEMAVYLQACIEEAD